MMQADEERESVNEKELSAIVFELKMELAGRMINSDNLLNYSNS